MSPYDIFMLIIFLGAVLFGFWKGLAWQVASFSAIVLSYIVALNFRDVIAGFIGAEPPLNNYIAMLILFLGTSLVVWIIFGRVRESIKKMHLKTFDRQAGALLGAAKGALLCMVATMFAVTLLGDKTGQAVVNSRSGNYISSSIDKLSAIIPDDFHGVIEPYLERYREAWANEQNQNPGSFQNPDQSPDNSGMFSGYTQPASYPGSGNPNGQTPYSGPAGGGSGIYSNPNNTNTNQTTPNYQDIPGQWQSSPGGYQNPNQNQNQNYQNPTPPNPSPWRQPPQGGQFGNQPQSGQYGNQTQYGQYGGNQQSGNQQPVNGQQGGPFMTPGQNGYPDLNFQINTEDLFNAGAEALKSGANNALDRLLEPTPTSGANR